MRDAMIFAFALTVLGAACDYEPITVNRVNRSKVKPSDVMGSNDYCDNELCDEDGIVPSSKAHEILPQEPPQGNEQPIVNAASCFVGEGHWHKDLGGREGTVARSNAQEISEEAETKLHKKPGLSYFAVEDYCDNDQCSQYEIVVGSERHEVSAEFVRSVKQLNAGACCECQYLKNVRFCFSNCRYKFRGLRDLVKVETCEEIAHDDVRYLYPFEDGRGFYSKIRVITGRNNGPSLDEDLLIDI